MFGGKIWVLRPRLAAAKASIRPIVRRRQCQSHCRAAKWRLQAMTVWRQMSRGVSSTEADCCAHASPVGQSCIICARMAAASKAAFCTGRTNRHANRNTCRHLHTDNNESCPDRALTEPERPKQAAMRAPPSCPANAQPPAPAIMTFNPLSRRSVHNRPCG